MSKLDKAKEYIGAVKVYMGFILASLMGTVAGTSKLYLSGETHIMFWIGTIGIVLLSVGFLLLMKHLHKKINDLEQL
ncbi:MAG: hypothetical protein COB07_05950 [Sulfurovum sp.]|nr:MAG: hypothetical protein COB07_05950 [Sulfurovum sp.]